MIVKQTGKGPCDRAEMLKIEERVEVESVPHRLYSVKTDVQTHYLKQLCILNEMTVLCVVQSSHGVQEKV
ncbi:hypothetical protein HanIR_Chr08g0382171 [Helianthus annuus]|nr:hypothetical protein HanIR_Chr08g0382171 [Helianthus annuus]